MLELKLNFEKSILDNLILREKIDTDILDKLINSDLLKKTFNNPFSQLYNCNEKDQLMNYRNLINDGYAYVKYNRVDNIPYGRSNPSKALGLYSIRREIRHTLAKNYYIDIDIENCHPNILLQICKMHNIKCDKLNEYVLNREKQLNNIINKYNVSEEQAKKLFIRLLYFGSFTEWQKDNNINTEGWQEIPRFIHEFSLELKEIGQQIYKNNEHIAKLILKRKTEKKLDDKNLIGSTVSYYLQEFERRILETIYMHCINNKIIINNDAVLCADGLMIPKDNYNKKLLKDFSKLIKNTYNLNLIFTTKEMNQDYLNILDDHIIKEDDKYINEDFTITKLTQLFNRDIEDYEDKYINSFHNTPSFHYFNNYHAYFYFSNKIHKIYKNQIYEYKHFNESFEHLFIKIGKQKYKFTNLYNKSKYKKIYSTFDFEPNKKDINDKYNLFTGFNYDIPVNYNESLILPFINHVKYTCNDNIEVYNYFISWMAHIIQNPNIKTNVAIVLYSIIEGICKNIIFDIFGKLLDGYNAKFRNTEGITDRFNGDLTAKLFVVGDEINETAYDIMNELKDIITRLEENIKFKGKDKIKVKDYKNYAFTTNNENVFKISNSDRRFMFIECPEVKKSNEYYKVLFDMKDNDNILSHLHYYLKNYDISKFNTRNIIITEYKKNIIIANIPAYIRFIKDDFNATYKNGKFTPLQLFKNSLEYTRVNKLQSTYTEQLFYKQFKKVFSEYHTTSNKINIYKFPNDINDIIKNIELNYLN
jgi:hypothetical protein